MLADPQKVTIDGTLTDFHRRLTGSDLGQFASAANNGKLEVRTSASATRTKHTMRLVVDKTFNDVNGMPTRASSVITFEVNRPKEGFTDLELQALVASLATWAGTTASSPILRVLRGEN